MKKPGRRCSLCCESWPDEPIYTKCPQCGETTERFNNLVPMDPDEARSILLHEQFKAYYERRCARRGIPAEGPLPEIEMCGD